MGLALEAVPSYPCLALGGNSAGEVVYEFDKGDDWGVGSGLVGVFIKDALPGESFTTSRN